MSSLVGRFLSPFRSTFGARDKSPDASARFSDSEDPHSERNSPEESDEIMARTAGSASKTKRESSSPKALAEEGDSSSCDDHTEHKAITNQDDAQDGGSDMDMDFESDSESDQVQVKKESNRRSPQHTVRVTKATKGRPPIRNPYSTAEDIAIIRFVINYKHNDSIGGNVFWQKCEKKNVTGFNRTEQSLKERWRKYILPNIGLYSSLSKCEKEIIAARFTLRSRTGPSGTKLKVVPKKEAAKRNVTRGDEDDDDDRKDGTESSDGSGKSEPEEEEEPKPGPSNARTVSRSAKKPAPRSRLSRPKSPAKAENSGTSDEEKAEENGDEESGGESDEKVDLIRRSTRKAGGKKLQGVPYLEKLRQDEEKEADVSVCHKSYTVAEDKQIIKCILTAMRKTKKPLLLSGNDIWKDLQASSRSPDRTWGSMRERWTKIIVPNLHQYDLPLADVKSLLKNSNLPQSKKERILSKCTSGSD